MIQADRGEERSGAPVEPYANVGRGTTALPYFKKPEKIDPLEDDDRPMRLPSRS